MESIAELIAKQAKRAPTIMPCPCPELPELDGKVFAREIGTDVYTSFVADIPTGKDAYVVVRPLLYSLCDESGKRIFENDAMAMAYLLKLPSKVILRWREVSDSLNYEGKAAEELEKKSEPEAISTTS